MKKNSERIAQGMEGYLWAPRGNGDMPRMGFVGKNFQHQIPVRKRIAHERRLCPESNINRQNPWIVSV